MTLWRLRITIVAVRRKHYFLFDVEVPITVKYIMLLSVAQQFFYGKFMSPKTIQLT